MNDEYVGSVKIPNDLVNEVEVREDSGKTIVYRARAFGLYFYDTAIRGRASLSCSLRSQVRLKTIIFTQPWRWHTIFQNDLKVELDEKSPGVKYIVSDNQIWSFEVKEGRPFFVTKRAKTCRDRSHGFEYRGALITEAANGGVLLKDQLLDEVFKPIDEKLVEIFNGVYMV